MTILYLADSRIVVEVLFTPGGSAGIDRSDRHDDAVALVRGLPELLDAQQRRAWEVRSTVDVGDALALSVWGRLVRRSPNWWRSPVLR